MTTNALAGLSLDAILGSSHKQQSDQAQADQSESQPQQQPPPPPGLPGRRTLIDIIKEEEPSKERRSWDHFRKTLLLKRTGEAWSSAVPQESAVSHSGSKSRSNLRSNSGEANRMVETMPLSDPYFKRGRSGRNNMMMEVEEDHDGSEFRKSTDSGSMRLVSAREAVAAQQAAEAAKAEVVKTTAVEEEEEDNKQQSMSLGDLMGGYGMEEEEEEEEEEDDDDDEAEADGGGIEHTCCMCMVRHKGAAFIPCGHTFCRLCSRELMVQRGNCPICNNFILEVLEIF